jgi:hypothetical protein
MAHSQKSCRLEIQSKLLVTSSQPVRRYLLAESPQPPPQPRRLKPLSLSVICASSLLPLMCNALLFHSLASVLPLKCFQNPKMSCTKDRMKIDTLLNPSYWSAPSSGSTCLYVLPSLNRPNRLTALLEPNRVHPETPVLLQDTSPRYAHNTRHVHSSGQNTWSVKLCSEVSSTRYIPGPMASTERLGYAYPLKGCREEFSSSRELRTHCSKAHLASLKYESKFYPLSVPVLILTSRSACQVEF